MHFAAWLAVGESVREAARATTRTTSSARWRVLEAMRDAGVERFVFSSTCAVYGEPSRVPIVETLDKRPINAYGETKLAIERALPHLEARTACSGSRCAISTPPARIPTARSAKTTPTRFT